MVSALDVLWLIVRPRRRHPLEVILKAQALEASINGRMQWPAIRAMLGFPFLLGPPEFSPDLSPVFKRDVFDAAKVSLLDGAASERAITHRPAAGGKRGHGDDKHCDDCADLLHGASSLVSARKQCALPPVRTRAGREGAPIGDVGQQQNHSRP